MGYACVNTACDGIQLTYASAETASRDANHTHLMPHVAMPSGKHTGKKLNKEGLRKREKEKAGVFLTLFQL
jgi:hypothetical protein